MLRIFDNLEPGSKLLPALQETFALSSRADFCVGYFNLRGWGGLAPQVDAWNPDRGPCRVLIGMQRLPHEELRASLSLLDGNPGIDNQTAHRLRVQLAEQLRQQLTIGIPTNADELTLRRLAAQLRAGRVVVKLFLRHPLHAKLYLLFRDDPVNPIVGYLGSSNLTFAGLSGQGELNVDVLDHDAALKLEKWFEDRWNDRFCIDITEELIQIIEESWAREALVPPYHVYLKMAYHLSHEARAGLAEFRIPKVFGDRLFDFQAAGVKIAAHHLNKRNGVLIGDVVGLGKTLMATAVARIFEDDYGLETLILCPKNLVPMWEGYVHDYQLRARVLSLSRVINELPNLRRYRLVVIDESHNLRNREGRRYRAIQEYVRANDSKCILLSATPYNKTYLDLSNQLRIFVEDDQDLGIRPERLLRELGEVEFSRRHQASPRTLAAFDQSEYADDWRDLMRRYLVRRTRSFIQDNYAETDPDTGRRFLTYEDGSRSFFPTRVPKTVTFAVDEADPEDQYAHLYARAVVDTVNALHLPRYGLGNYVAASPPSLPTREEERQIQDLSRAGKRLMGFCRTNLFKRLESSGAAFLQSVERHILRNYVFLHAIRNGLPLPLGTQDAEMLDSRFTDADTDGARSQVNACTAALPGVQTGGTPSMKRLSRVLLRGPRPQGRPGYRLKKRRKHDTTRTDRTGGVLEGDAPHPSGRLRGRDAARRGAQGRAGHSLAARSADALCRRLGPQGRPRLGAHGSKRAAVQQLADVGLAPVVLSQATGTAETEAALTMLERVPTARRITVGADKGYDTREFVTTCRSFGITPHVAMKQRHSALDRRTSRHVGYAASQRAPSGSRRCSAG